MIRLRNVGVQYRNGNGTGEALRGLDLEIGTEFLGVVGPSGCGKTTLLRVLAGLITPTAGRVETDATDGFSYGIVFQDYSLLPWLTVRQNIELGLRIRRVPSAERGAISRRLLSQLALTDSGDSLPHQLSGGMRQRVAVGRAFAQTPPLLLMDEPFGALDAITRADLQQTLAELHESEPHTVVFVTHDVEEALLLSDRVCVMTARPGSVQELVKVDFPRPRERSIKRAPEFLRLGYQIEDLLADSREDAAP